MTLDDIKQTAKRLRKQSPELTLAASSPLTHTQALDVVARLHGFRHYREAQARLDDSATVPAHRASTGTSPMHKARNVLAESGGITLAGGLRFDFGCIRISANEPLTIEGPSGCGKSYLTKELICHALAQGTKVRVLDSYGEYRHFTLALGGQYLSELDAPEFQDAWSSDAPFVVVNAETFYPREPLFSHLRGLPADALFICEDIDPRLYEQLNAPTIRIKHCIPRKADDWRGFRHNPEAREPWGHWLLNLADFTGPIKATLKLGGVRDEAWPKQSRWMSYRS